MDRLNKWYLRLSEFQKGQTMAEYGLILVAVAIVAVVGYQTLGTDISTFVSGIGSSLTGGS